MELLILIAAVVAMFQVFKQKKRLDEIGRSRNAAA